MIEQILKKYQKPSYIFDIDVLNKRIDYLQKKLNNRITLVYAMKANSFILKEIENKINRIEVCSPGEYKICQKLKIDSSKLLISGVSKTKEVIESMLTNNDIGYYSIESLNQYKLLNNLTNKLNKKIKVFLRLTSGNQFGISLKELELIIKNRNKNSNITITGIQYFSGTQKHSLNKIKKEIEYLDNTIQLLKEKYNYTLEELEYGGGFPISYFQSEEFNEEEYLKEFNEIITNMKYSGPISLELGRSIASSCGTYLTKVVDLKENENGIFAIVDGGIHQLVYYGQTLAMKIPYYDTYPKRDGIEKKYNICGSLCTINDILVKSLNIKDLKVGDIIIFKNTGAYCMTEGISLFLSRDLPEIYLVKNNKIKKVRDNYETWVLNTPNDGGEI